MRYSDGSIRQAATCARCPFDGGTTNKGAGWCNGDCSWDTFTNNCMAPVSCGSHSRATCALCPFSGGTNVGANWCNGDCSWDTATSECKPKGWNSQGGSLLGCGNGGDGNWYTQSNAGQCLYSMRPHKTTSGCCGSCASGSSIYHYTCGTYCQNTPCSACPAHFTPVPSVPYDSRSRKGFCPASRPHETTGVSGGCCGACSGSDGNVYPYRCTGGICSAVDASQPSQGIFCQAVVAGFYQPPSPPPPPAPPPPGLNRGNEIL